MIDFHSHILPNVDDGVKSLEQSIELIDEAEKVGFTGIISTSHYIQGYYEDDEEQRRKILNELQGKSPKMKLYLGSEIYSDLEMIKYIKEGKPSTINGSRYVLFEFPLNSEPLFAKKLIYDLLSENYIPVIAHPERYSYVQENLKFIEELVQMGALLQCNYGSIIGMYGHKAKKTFKEMLKKDMVKFMGSDVHRVGQVYPLIPKILKKMKKLISEEKLYEITTLNPEKVLKNEII